MKKEITPEEAERRRIRHLETNQLWRKSHPEKTNDQRSRYREKYRIKLRADGQKRYAEEGKIQTEAVKRALMKWRYSNWHKVLAQCKLQRAVKSGRVIKPTSCSSCGQTNPLHGHHDDYSKPLEVRWLCSSCHKLFHLAIDKKMEA